MVKELEPTNVMRLHRVLVDPRNFFSEVCKRIVIKKNVVYTKGLRLEGIKFFNFEHTDIVRPGTEVRPWALWRSEVDSYLNTKLKCRASMRLFLETLKKLETRVYLKFSRF